MSVLILGSGTARNKDLPIISRRAGFRKATQNMVLAFSALEETLSGMELPKDASTALVVGTSLGEIEVTQDFLTTLAGSGVSRPWLFQSSLHNATIGFLSLHLGIQGPTITISARQNTGERALETAFALLQSGMVPTCLVVGVEKESPALSVPMRCLDSPGAAPKEGAGALLLATEEGRVNFPGSRILGILEKIETRLTKQAACDLFHDSLYDSDAIEQLALNLRKANASPSMTHELQLAKSDQSFSRITWKSPS